MINYFKSDYGKNDLTKDKKISDLARGDRIKGVHCTLQVIGNDNGVLSLYNENTGYFVEQNLRRSKNNFVEVYIPKKKYKGSR